MGIESTVEVDHPIEEVWAWHERPGALTRLMPPFGLTTVRTESRSLVDGVAELGLPGGLTFRSRHDPAGYQRLHRFVDVGQVPTVAGKLVPWRHEHVFTSLGPSRTRIVDRVETPLPRVALSSMFAFRNRQLADDLATQARMREFGERSLTVAVSGASGTIGRALTALLTTGGHTVIRLVRGGRQAPDRRPWNPVDPHPDLLEGVDAVVHLAGESIAGRFGPAHKAKVRDSRVGPTAALARIAGQRPFVSASAIGFYGPHPGQVVNETSSAGEGFLAEVVQDWEAEAHQAAGRVVCVRTGLVQSAAGGLLALQRPIYAAGLGGLLGSGRQWWSWIALDDLVDVYLRAILDDGLSGPVNAVAPHPVQQREWAATMGRVLRRPTLLPTPALGPKLLLGGEGARELALASQRVTPTALQHAGHQFRFPLLEGALRHELGHDAG